MFEEKEVCEEERFYNLEDEFLLLESLLQTWLFFGDTKWEESGGIYSIQGTYFYLKSREFY